MEILQYGLTDPRALENADHQNAIALLSPKFHAKFYRMNSLPSIDGIGQVCPQQTTRGAAKRILASRAFKGEAFPTGPRAPLKWLEFTGSNETTSPEFPFLLMTGRTLYQFNVGTMTMRTLKVPLMAVGIQKLPRDD